MVKQNFFGAMLLRQQFDFIGLAGTDEQGGVRGAPLAGDRCHRLHACRLCQQTQLLQVAIKIRQSQIHTDQYGSWSRGEVGGIQMVEIVERADASRSRKDKDLRRGGLIVRNGCSQINSTPRHNGRNRMLVNHLGYRVAQEHHVLVKRLNLTLEFDAVDQIHRDGNVLAAQGVQKRVLQELAFVVHDILRVGKLGQGKIPHWQGASCALAPQKSLNFLPDLHDGA